MKLALAQVDAVPGSFEKNVATHERLAHKAKEAKADLVCFPELSLTGYGVKDLNAEMAVNTQHLPDLFAPLLKLSKDLVIVAGGIELGDDGGIYNVAFLFEKGTCRIAHRKVYPPTYGMFEEMRYFSRGRSIRAIDTSVGRLGVQICEDAWHMSVPYLLALDGAELLLTLVASPTRLGPGSGAFGPEVVNGENSRAYARLLSTPVSFCNRIGYEDGVNFWGGSHVVGPDGTVLASAPLFEEALVTVEIRRSARDKARLMSRHFLDEDILLTQRELDRISKAQGGV
jgi:predicted amidohydrolase